MQQPTALPTVVDSWIYAELYNEAAVNSGRSTKFTAEQIADFRNGGTNVKWIRELYKDYAPMMSHNLSMTGGAKNLSYMASVGYLDQNSLFKGPGYGFDRYNGRLNVSHKVSDRLTLTATGQFTRNKIKDHAYWTEWIIEQANRMPAIYEIKNPDGTYTYPSGSNSNSLERLEAGGYRQSVNDDLSGTLSADFKIVEGLRLGATVGGRALNNATHENRMASLAAASGDKENHISESFYRATKLTATTTLSYEHTFAEKHNFALLLGYAYEGESAKNFSTQRLTDNSKYDIFVGDLKGDDVSNNGGASDWSLYSGFGRLTYNYDEKYLFEFNVRNDYSSYFAKGNRSGLFPSFSLGWRVSQEPWWESIRPVIPSLKLRGSWGLVGNNRIGAYRYMQTVTVTQGITFGDELAPTAYFASVDPAIKWETTRMADLGLDMGLLKNDLNLSFDFFQNRTRDILVGLPVPGLFGNGAPTSNAATVDSYGWEFSLNYHWRGPLLRLRCRVHHQGRLPAVFLLCAAQRRPVPERRGSRFQPASRGHRPARRRHPLHRQGRQRRHQRRRPLRRGQRLPALHLRSFLQHAVEGLLLLRLRAGRRPSQPLDARRGRRGFPQQQRPNPPTTPRSPTSGSRTLPTCV